MFTSLSLIRSIKLSIVSPKKALTINLQKSFSYPVLMSDLLWGLNDNTPLAMFCVQTRCFYKLHWFHLPFHNKTSTLHTVPDGCLISRITCFFFKSGVPSFACLKSEPLYLRGICFVLVTGCRLWGPNLHSQLQQSNLGRTKISVAPIWRSKTMKLWLIEMLDEISPMFYRIWQTYTYTHIQI